MKATVIDSKNTDDIVVKVNGIIGFIKEKMENKPQPGDQIDIMLTGIKITESQRAILFCKLITDEVLVDHEGFEATGKSGRTLAKVPGSAMTLTPSMTGVIVAKNSVRFRDDWEESVEPLTPGKVYINQKDLGSKGFVRICGLDSIHDMDFFARNPQLLERKSRPKRPRNETTKPAPRKVMHLEVGTEKASEEQLAALADKFAKR